MTAAFLVAGLFLAAPTPRPKPLAYEACPVDLLDAGDGASIRAYARRIERGGFRVAHTGQARDAHDRLEIFFAPACEAAAKALAKVLEVAAPNVQVATWRLVEPITVVPPGTGTKARKDACDLPEDYACLVIESPEQTEQALLDPSGCAGNADECKLSCRADCATKCDPVCKSTCSKCLGDCVAGAAGNDCRQACGTARRACREHCEAGCPEGCAAAKETCRADYYRKACVPYCGCLKTKQCDLPPDPDRDDCAKACANQAFPSSSWESVECRCE